MGVAIYIQPKIEIEDFDDLVDGKAVAGVNEETWDGFCRELGVTSLMELASQNPEELNDLMDELEEDMELPDEQWFPASEGLKTVKALIAHLELNPGAVFDVGAVLEDLKGYERVLERFDREGIEFHFALDF